MSVLAVDSPVERPVLADPILGFAARIDWKMENEEFGNQGREFTCKEAQTLVIAELAAAGRQALAAVL